MATRRKQPAKRKGPTPRRTDERDPADEPATTPRYTPPPGKTIRFRPVWHKIVGGALVLAGIAVIIINFAGGEDSGVPPGGHNELYFVLGLALIGASSWWFGLFDPPAGL